MKRGRRKIRRDRRKKKKRKREIKALEEGEQERRKYVMGD